MNETVVMQTRFCSLEHLRKQSLSLEFKKGDKLKIIFPRKLSAELYGNICYYTASCILSDWRNYSTEMALHSCLEQAKDELETKGIRF